MKEFATYAFAEVDMAKDRAEDEGFKVIDFGVGDPKDPLYEGAVEGLQRGAREHSTDGYPSYIGLRSYRVAAADWLATRFGVRADPESQVTATAGSKEAIFHFPFSVLDPGDAVLMPSIGYPPYKSGTIFAGCRPTFYRLAEERGFVPDVAEIEESVRRNGRTKLVWINFPNNPTTAVANERFFEEIIEVARKHQVVVASDEAYTEMYEREKPRSILEFTDDWSNIIVFQSLSKRSNATGLRVGFAVGGKEIVERYRGFRTQVDSGVPNAIQEAATAALADEDHVAKMRESYNAKRAVMAGALRRMGMRFWASSTFYIWLKVGSDSTGFSKRMLTLDKSGRRGINVTPGWMLALSDGAVGDSYVRLALVPSLEETKEAAEILEKHHGDERTSG